jgi:hypothetical protein
LSPARIRQALRKSRHSIEELGPYQSLALLVLPLCLVEPSKLAAVALIGDGHWLTGTATMAAVYAATLLLVERIFLIVKPRLLKLHWFAKGWAWMIVQRYRLAREFSR